MKTARYFLLAFVLGMSTLFARADETVTVSSTGSDISENLDLRAVATLFGEVSNLEEFERELNSEERHLSNLDLNGDGIVDYLRVVEMESNGSHLIIIQAVLAKDIYQDVASIYVEKDETAQVRVQVVGDVWLYGENYIIEPVYIYRPLIYDWFFSSVWFCWTSPWYWGNWPLYWGHGWAPWAYDRYCRQVHVYHHAHPRCTFRYARQTYGSSMRSTASSRGVSRRDLAARAPERGFSSRNAGMANARQMDTRRTAAVQSSRSAVAAQTTRATGAQTARRVSTFDSSFQRAAASSTRTASATTASRTTSGTTSRSTSATTSSRGTSAHTSSTTRSATVNRTPANTSSTTRSTSTYSPRTSSSSTTTRSTSTYTPPRTSGSTATRSPGSYGGGTRSTGSYGGGATRGGGGGGSRGGGTVRR